MEVDVTGTISRSFKRLGNRNSLILALYYFILSFLTSETSTVVLTNWMQGVIDKSSDISMAKPLVLGFLPTPLAAILMVVSILATAFLLVVIIRTVVSDETEDIPEDAWKRNIGFVFINFIAGFIIHAILISAGFMLLVIPGLYILAALFLWHVVVCVEDKSFIEGFKKSWNMTEGNLLRIWGVILLILLTSILFTIAQLIGMFLIGYMASYLVFAVYMVFVFHCVADIYNQLS